MIKKKSFYSSNDFAIYNGDSFKLLRQIDEKTIDQLKEEENAVICMMSCASIEHLKQAYKELKKEKE